MSEGSRPARVGVRELRQNLSIYLQRVKDGETLEVTEHGHPVAVLGPRPEERRSRLDQLIAEGRAVPAKGDLLELGPPLELPPDLPSPLAILLRMREEDRG